MAVGLSKHGAVVAIVDAALEDVAVDGGGVVDVAFEEVAVVFVVAVDGSVVAIFALAFGEVVVAVALQEVPATVGGADAVVGVGGGVAVAFGEIVVVGVVVSVVIGGGCVAAAAAVDVDVVVVVDFAGNAEAVHPTGC